MSKKKKKQKQPKDLVRQYVDALKLGWEKIYSVEDVISNRQQAGRVGLDSFQAQEQIAIQYLATGIDTINAGDYTSEQKVYLITQLTIQFITMRRNTILKHYNTCSMDEACFEKACLDLAKKPLH